MFLNEDIRSTLTTSSGAASTTITNVKNKVIKNILIKPASSDTQYDFSITDKNSNVIYNDTGLVGTTSPDVDIYLYGNITIALANATADEAFTVILTSNEHVS